MKATAIPFHRIPIVVTPQGETVTNDPGVQPRTVSEAPPLQPIAWGKRDRALGYMACAAIEKAMPETLWHFDPKPYAPRWVGWLAVAVVALLVLAAFGGRS